MAFVDFKDIRKEERSLGGRTVSVAVTPRISHRRGRIRFSLKSLWNGMCLTFGYFRRPSTVVTQQYPENRATLRFPARYRAILKMVYEDNGCHRCTGCRICERACPNASIKVLTRKNPVSGKMELDRHIWRQDSCMVCNACVQGCPFDALTMGHEFESAVYDRRLLIYTLNRYAGPPASVLMKTEDLEARRKMMEPRGRYDGPVPLGGTAYPNVNPIVIPQGTAAGPQEPAR